MRIRIILDESGSMNAQLNSTISGFNEFLQEQKANSPDNLISLIKFSSHATVAFRDVKPRLVAELNKNTYLPNGMTALYDAVGFAIADLHDIPEDEKVMLVIITDGCENSSKEYKLADIKALLEDKQAKGWQVMYLGVGVKDFSDASNLGIRKDRIVGTLASVDMGNVFRGAAKFAKTFDSDADDADLDAEFESSFKDINIKE